MLALPLPAYIASCIAYAVYFARRSPAAGRAATALLGGAALAHTFVIGMQTMEVGHVPFAGTTQAISTFVWLLGLAYLYIEISTDERGLGAFVLPILVGLQAIPAAQGPGIEPRTAILDSPMFGVHVSSLLFAYATFALAAVIGVTYLLQFMEIKAKHLGYFYARLPSLQVLDVMNARAVFIGWVLLTLGLLVGAIWIPGARAVSPEDPRVGAMRLADPKILVAVVTWAVYAVQLGTRRLAGWRGRRSAYLSVLGFLIVLFNFIPVSYFLTDSHNFS